MYSDDAAWVPPCCTKVPVPEYARYSVVAESRPPLSVYDAALPLEMESSETVCVPPDCVKLALPEKPMFS